MFRIYNCNVLRTCTPFVTVHKATARTHPGTETWSSKKKETQCYLPSRMLEPLLRVVLVPIRPQAKQSTKLKNSKFERGFERRFERRFERGFEKGFERVLREGLRGGLIRGLKGF